MVDEKDKEILFELLQDCTQATSKIAKKVKLPRQTVDYRIKKLEKEKVIKKYTINVDYQKLGFNRHSLYLDMKSIPHDKVNKYLDLVTDIQEVSCCYMLHGVSKWKLYLSVWTKTIERYDEIQTKIMSKFKKYIKNYLSFQGVRSYTYFARRLKPKAKAKVDVKHEMDHIELKPIEWKLLNLLKKNSRLPVVDLAKKLHVSVNTIMRKMKQLTKKGIIQRFYPILHMKKLGYTEYTFISRIDPSCEKELKEFLEYTKKDNRFVIVIKAVGYVNLYYAFLVKDGNELHEITSKIEDIFGNGLLETHKIEVEDMIS